MTRNLLDQETSPYLLQHAHNPVDWYPWGEEALDTARWCLADTLACGIMALAYPACTKLLGPVVILFIAVASPLSASLSAGSTGAAGCRRQPWS